MGKFVIFLLVLAALPIVNAVCIIPEEGMGIRENSLLCHGNYNIEKGISIISDNIIVDCNNSALAGNGIGYGVLLKNKKNVTIQNCNISNYEIGIYLDNANNSIIEHNHLTKNKFGIALFNSFDNDAGNNVLIDNLANNVINYLPASIVEEKAENEKKDIATPQKVIEEVIRIKKPLLKEQEVISEVDHILGTYFNITQQNLEIARTIFYNESDKSTSIMLRLKPKKILLNVSIYEKIPKCISAYASQVLFETGGYEVIQDDPLILWAFPRLDDKKEINYKVLRIIDEECQALLFAFGIASGFQEFEKAEMEKKKNRNYLFAAVIAVLLSIAAIYFIKKKLS